MKKIVAFNSPPGTERTVHRGALTSVSDPWFTEQVMCTTKSVSSKGVHPLPRGFPGGGSAVKNPPANTGDLGSIPGLGRSSGEGDSNAL